VSSEFERQIAFPRKAPFELQNKMEQKGMEKETAKLLNVLRRIARAGGYAAWAKSEPDTARFLVGQYNKVLTRLSELEPAIKPLFTPLSEDASPEVIRIAARELFAYFEPDVPELGWSRRRSFAFGCRPRRGRVGCIPISMAYD
jgi:hypothetical protein